VIAEDRVAFNLADVEVHYGELRALRGVTMAIGEREITALIGPSGCGKTTLLRALDRMHDVTPGARVGGRIAYRGVDLYGPGVSVTEIRRRIGMVFQKPNPFPSTVFENIAYGARIHGVRERAQLAEVVERSLRAVGLWDEVKDRLREHALSLSGGQQQRLCLARSLAVEPEVVLMDEPCSSLDPISTMRIEELMRELARRYTIVIVTHNMQQAARVSDRTAFFTAELDAATDRRTGVLVEVGPTATIFGGAADERTLSYVQGRFG
jgi:phosphate transport system ATP-binding protein